MKSKAFYRSKEVWVLGVALAITVAVAFGVEFEGLIADATALVAALAVPVALILRVFFTDSGITLK